MNRRSLPLGDGNLALLDNRDSLVSLELLANRVNLVLLAVVVTLVALDNRDSRVPLVLLAKEVLLLQPVRSSSTQWLVTCWPSLPLRWLCKR